MLSDGKGNLHTWIILCEGCGDGIKEVVLELKHEDSRDDEIHMGKIMGNVLWALRRACRRLEFKRVGEKDKCLLWEASLTPLTHPHIWVPHFFHGAPLHLYHNTNSTVFSSVHSLPWQTPNVHTHTQNMPSWTERYLRIRTLFLHEQTST